MVKIKASDPMPTAATSIGVRRRRRRHPDALAVEEAKEMMNSWFPDHEDGLKERRRKRRRKKSKTRKWEREMRKREREREMRKRERERKRKRRMVREADDDGDHGDKQAQEERKEEETSAAVAAAMIEDRVSLLKEIVKAMKSVDSSSCCSLPTVDEQRLLNLIHGHVHSCILLYYTLKGSAAADSSHNELLSVPEVRPSINKELPAHGDLNQTIEDFLGSHIWSIQEALQDCRRSISGASAAADPRETRPTSGSVLGQLVDVLHTLHVLEQRRDYAPPQDVGDEIGRYKEIRKWAASSLIYTVSRMMNDPSLISRQHDFILHSYPHGWLRQGMAPTTLFFPFGHMFAIAFDLVPQYQALFRRCKNHLSQILLSGYEEANDDGLVDAGEEAQLLRWKPAEKVEAESGMGRILNKTRLECLNIIIAKMEKSRSSTVKAKLNDREVQLYAHIAEHVRASTWLSGTTGTPLGESRMVSVADVREIAPLGDEDGSYTREQYLEDIVSYMRAFEPVFSVDQVLTQQEGQAYHNIWRMLRADFVWCSYLKPADSQRGKKRKEPPWLKEGMLAIHDRVNRLIQEMKEESNAILQLVLNAIIPGVIDKVKEASSPGDAFVWFRSNKEEVASRMRGFFRDKSSHGVALIDLLMVRLGELLEVQISVLGKIEIAAFNTDHDWRISNFMPLEMEVMNLRCTVRQ